VQLNPEGKITEEWETLVHPGQPIPNTHIHGIDDALVTGAPHFAEIAGTLAAKLHEHVVVAHTCTVLTARFLRPISRRWMASICRWAQGSTPCRRPA
jgi:DNA polymerase III epsilon subunit-like protein